MGRRGEKLRSKERFPDPQTNLLRTLLSSLCNFHVVGHTTNLSAQYISVTFPKFSHIVICLSPVCRKPSNLPSHNSECCDVGPTWHSQVSLHSHASTKRTLTDSRIAFDRISHAQLSLEGRRFLALPPLGWQPPSRLSAPLRPCSTPPAASAPSPRVPVPKPPVPQVYVLFLLYIQLPCDLLHRQSTDTFSRANITPFFLFGSDLCDDEK